MDLQSISNIVLSALSFILAVSSVIVAMRTLRQNRKMIEESSRPIISIYSQSIALGASSLYLVVKNFGNSTAYLTKFTSDFDFSNCFFGLPKNYIEQLSACTIAPGQSRVCCLDRNKIPDNVHFSIEYKSSTKTYSEEMDVNLLSAVSMPISKTENKGTELCAISLTLQEMLIKNM